MIKCADALLRIKHPDGRHLFKEERKVDIQKLAQSMCDADPALTNKGGAFQKAWSELWDDEDHEQWARLAKERIDVDAWVSDCSALSNMLMSVLSNQEAFTEGMAYALSSFCQLGGLGDAEMILLMNFRDRFNATKPFS